jgi:type I restriction enzyme R subunit
MLHVTASVRCRPRSLYESPFTDLNPMGIAGLFSGDEVTEMVGVIEKIRERAAA